MRKPVWVSFFGWSFIFLFFVPVGLGLVKWLAMPSLEPSVITGLMTIFSVPCFVLWVLGTIIHKIQAHGARLQAEAVAQAMQNLKASEGKLANFERPRAVTSPLDLMGRDRVS